MGPRALTLTLGTAQTLAWASSYYIPAILAAPMARATGLGASTMFGAFSLALIVSAMVGPISGRVIDRFGGRSVLMASNGIFSLGLLILSIANTSLHVFTAWAVIGIAMGCGLYEAAFSTLVRLRGSDARSSITGITLLAGFASTVGWPLSSYAATAWGWRDACVMWAILHVCIGLPLNALIPRSSKAMTSTPTILDKEIQHTASQQRRAAIVLPFVFASSWFISTAMAAHLPGLLVASGASLVAAVAIGSLVGPAQVAGRVFEFTLLKGSHPLLSARLATMAHPLACMCLGLFGVPAAIGFAVLHGLGNGVLTIAMGTLPLYFFGAKGYGARQGKLMVPARLVQAAAPFAYGAALEAWGLGALWLSAGLGLSATAALMTLTASRRTPSKSNLAEA